jgi:uncharacterized protein
VTPQSRASGREGAGRFCLPHPKEAIMADREAVIQRLSEASEEFRRLKQEHGVYEQELSGLQSRSFLTTEQQWRVSELKKLKLMGKDRMETLIREQQRSAQTPA